MSVHQISGHSAITLSPLSPEISMPSHGSPLGPGTCTVLVGHGRRRPSIATTTTVVVHNLASAFAAEHRTLAASRAAGSAALKIGSIEMVGISSATRRSSIAAAAAALRPGLLRQR